MSEIPMIELPTNKDFGLEEVKLVENPDNYPVATPVLPGRSDDELRMAAESGNWDLYTSHGIDQDPLPLYGLLNRFKDAYRGERVDEPGGFIKAVLAMQRTIPTAQEYATVLARDGLIRPDEATNLPKDFSYELLKTDEGTEQARAHFKVLYLANAEVSELRTQKAAANYASDKIKADSDPRARSRAAEAMYLARGVEAKELPKLLANREHRSGRHLQLLGVPDNLIDKLGSAPRSSASFSRYNSSETIVDYGLASSSLDTQIAYRRFFGMKNLVTMATSHAAVESPFDDNSVAFSRYAIGASLAGSLLVHTVLDSNTPFISRFLETEVASDLGITTEMPLLGSFASFMMREPALNGKQNHIYPRSDVLGHNVVNMVTADYRVLLDERIDKERRELQG